MFAGQNSVSRRRSLLQALCFLFCFGLFLFPGISRADTLEDVARAFARKVGAVLQRNHAVKLLWQNRSSIPDAQSEMLREWFEKELGIESVAGSQESGVSALHVSVEETPSCILLVAEIPSSPEGQTRMSAFPRSALPLPDKPSTDRRLQKELIWQQREPILDAVEFISEESKQNVLLLLSRDSFSHYEGGKGHWVLRSSKPIPAPEAPTRDPRGQIQFSSEHENQVQINLPGRVCEVKLADESVPTCKPGTEPWVQAQLLTSACSQVVWSLQTDSGDWSTPDRVWVRSLSASFAEPPVTELEVPGPVISISPGKGLQAGTAVVWSLSTGNYEVYRITIACGS